MHGGPALLSTAAFRYGVVLTDPMGKGALRGTLEYTMDWRPAIVLTKPKVVYGAGVAPVGLRWNLVSHPRLHPYGELVLGGVLSSSNIPPGDTLNINFTINTGGGLTVYNRGNQMLSIGLDYSHLSNGYLGRQQPGIQRLRHRARISLAQTEVNSSESLGNPATGNWPDPRSSARLSRVLGCSLH